MAGSSSSNGDTCTYHVEGNLTFNWDQPGVPLSLQLDIVLDSGAGEYDDEDNDMDGVGGGGIFQNHIHPNPWLGSNTHPSTFPSPFEMNMENQAVNLNPIKFASVISEPPETPKSSTLTHDGTSPSSLRALPRLVSKKRKKELFKENEEEENKEGLRRKRVHDNPLEIVPFRRRPSNSSSTASSRTRSSLSSENSSAWSSLSREERALTRAAAKRGVSPNMQLALDRTNRRLLRPRNAFIYFVMCKREKIVSTYLHSKFGEISRLLGQTWQDLSDTHKQYYRDMAEEDLIRYYDAKLRLESRTQRSFRMGLTRLLNRLQEARNLWISRREPQLLLEGDDDDDDDDDII